MGARLNGRMKIVTGDITTLHVDVIVNAANAALCGGGGVDGAIHRAAGPELLAECLTLGGARPGEVRLTRAYRLPAQFVAHAVGPVWQGGERGEPELLALCYSRALELVKEKGLQSVAFPAISTGAYRFPFLEAARIAQRTVRDYLLANALPQQVTFCCFSAADAHIYERVAAELLGASCTMFCPKCGDTMQGPPGHPLSCEKGGMELSVELERRLRDCYVEGTRRPKEVKLPFVVGGKWFCPGCGVPTQELRPGDVRCPECDRSLSEFIHALVELHPHR